MNMQKQETAGVKICLREEVVEVKKFIQILLQRELNLSFQ